MNQNRANFISERVRVVPPVSADTLRYQYLNLRNAEPNLGVPSITAASFNDYILTTDQIGQRQFKTTAIWDLTYTSYSTNSGNFLTRQQADLRLIGWSSDNKKVDLVISLLETINTST